MFLRRLRPLDLSRLSDPSCQHQSRPLAPLFPLFRSDPLRPLAPLYLHQSDPLDRSALSYPHRLDQLGL